MYKILILAYLVGSDPVITQQNFEMEGWFKTMEKCQTELLSQHPDQTYRVMREFVEDNDFKLTLFLGLFVSTNVLWPTSSKIDLTYFVTTA